LRNPEFIGFLRRIIESERLASRPYWKHGCVKGSLVEHIEGRKDNSGVIWRIINMEIWLRLFIDTQEPLNSPKLQPERLKSIKEVITILKVPLLRPHFDCEELEEIRKVLESGWVSQGPKVKEFEAKVAERLGARYAIAVTNCTCALHLSLLSIGIKEGDEVLVADYTFPATGHSILYCKARPVFVDVNPGTYNIDSEKMEEKISDKTRAVIPVHTFGQPADMDRIMEIAEKHGLKVVEDAACALGARFKNKYAGTMGDMGCMSFHARKGITTGEGGMIVTDNEDYAEKARYLSVFGMTAAWDREKSDRLVIPEFCDVGYNYKMSDITAAVGVAQMRKLDAIIARKEGTGQVLG